MANSPLDIHIPQMNPSTGIPEGIDPNNLTEEQKAWLRYLQDEAYRNGYLDIPPGMQLRSGNSFGASSPTAPPASAPPLPSSQIPATPGSFGLPGEIASQGASAGVPPGGAQATSVMAGAGALERALNAGNGGSGILDRIKGFLTDPSNLVGLAGVVGGLSRGGGGSSPDVQRLNAITEQRMRRVDPLHQAITQLAWGRLPTSSRNGIAPPTNTPLP